MGGPKKGPQNYLGRVIGGANNGAQPSLPVKLEMWNGSLLIDRKSLTQN